jgi:protein-disulfide isomerase
MSIFSARYRPLAKEGFRCVFRTLTMKPCDTGMDERLKAELVAGVLKISPPAAKLVNRHFAALSWLFVLLTLASMAYTAYGLYNFYFFGNCDGPGSVNSCIINDITNDYGRFSAPADLIAPASYDGITVGNPNASVKIVEFGCFTCPYTAEAEPVMQTLLKRHNGSIYYVFKPFPVPNHKYSVDAARAVLCANSQGKQWELREAIFAQQNACSSSGAPEITQLAAAAGLDMNAFNRCFDNNESGAELAKYIQEGKDAHIYATPTFFINGKALVGPKSVDEFEKIIAEAGQQ